MVIPYFKASFHGACVCVYVCGVVCPTCHARVRACVLLLCSAVRWVAGSPQFGASLRGPASCVCESHVVLQTRGVSYKIIITGERAWWPVPLCRACLWAPPAAAAVVGVLVTLKLTTGAATSHQMVFLDFVIAFCSVAFASQNVQKLILGHHTAAAPPTNQPPPTHNQLCLPILSHTKQKWVTSSSSLFKE